MQTLIFLKRITHGTVCIETFSYLLEIEREKTVSTGSTCHDDMLCLHQGRVGQAPIYIRQAERSMSTTFLLLPIYALSYARKTYRDLPQTWKL